MKIEIPTTTAASEVICAIELQQEAQEFFVIPSQSKELHNQAKELTVKPS